MRRRPAAAVDPEPEPTTDEPEEPPRPWHSATMVRVILVLLALFALMHFFLWKVVYDFAMATNQERLRGTVREAISSLYAVVEHL